MRYPVRTWRELPRLSQRFLYARTGFTCLPIGARVFISHGVGDEDDAIRVELGGGSVAQCEPGPDNLPELREPWADELMSDMWGDAMADWPDDPDEA